MSHPQQPAPRTKAVWPFVLMAVFALPTGIAVSYLLGLLRAYSFRYGLGIPYPVVGLGIPLLVFIAMLVGGIVGAIIRANSNSRMRRANTAAAPAAPVGYTAEGKPVYPVVGYTQDGRPVTANQLMGRQTENPGTERYS